MIRLSGIAGHWSGLCPKRPRVHASRAESDNGSGPACDGQPGSGSGRPVAIRRGIGAALSGMRTLNRNRQLFWFVLLAGIVLAGNIISQGALGYVSWAMQPYIGEAEWILLNFIIEYTTLFCLMILLTGLVLSISSKNEGHASFFKGLAGVKKYSKAIALWSVVLALAGMLLFGLYFYSPGWLPRNDTSQHIIGILYEPVNVLYEFPFNPGLTPSSMFDPYREGAQHSLVSWIYPSGIVQAMTFSLINLLLFILTAFVVPLIVLDQKTPYEAIAGSFAMMRKNWAEAAACTIVLGIIALGVFLTYLLVQGVSGLAAPGMAAPMHPDTAWIAAALVYDSALFCFALIMTTAGGIAAQEIYSSAKRSLGAAESTVSCGGAL